MQDTAQLRDYLRRDADPYQHPVGTCRIGTDPAAVVDPQLQVHGVERLRVADVSVMPTIPGANTHAAVLAIAERAPPRSSASDGSAVRDRHFDPKRSPQRTSGANPQAIWLETPA